mgnify:CR=1 FL=1
MSLVTAVKEETNLAGVMKSQLTPTGLSFTALFYDTKTGVQRTPQSTTLTFMVNKDGSKAERIRLSSHSTVAATGITTCTIASSGRALPLFGTGAGSSTGNQHEPGDPIGCVTNHEPAAQINSWMEGTVGSGAAALRVGLETDVDVYYYAQNSDASKPFLAYLAASNAWAFSNDGVSSTLIGSGASTYTGGDGLLLTGSDFDIDLADTVIFVQASSGAGDAGKVPRLSAGTGKLATGFITAAPYLTYISDHPALVGGAASNADSSHTHGGLLASVTAGEAVNGATTAQPISILGNNYKGVLVAEANGRTFFSTITGTSTAVGDVDARGKQGQSFTITDALANAITLESITLMMEVTGAPGDYVTLEISADNGSGYPSATIITNGTATAVVGSTFTVDARPQKFTFATPPTLVSGTTYHWAIRRSTVSGGASALDAANYYRLFTAGADTFAGSSSSYTASTLTWSGTSTTDYQFILQYNLDYDNKGFIADGDTFPRTKLSGFTKSNVAAAGTLAVATEFIDGLSLTGGADYFLDSTQGALTTTAPSIGTSFGSLTPLVHAGFALNSTTLKIEPWYESVLLIADVYSSGQPITQNAADATFDVFIETGFRPKEFDVRYTVTNKAATANDDTYVITRFIGTTQYPIITIKGANFTDITAAAGGSWDATAITYVGIQAIYENGYLLRIFSTEATAEALANLQVIAKS